MAAALVDQATHVNSKAIGGQQDIFEKSHGSDVSDTSGRDPEQAGEEYQRGVRQARAITTVWNTNTLWLMFALYDQLPPRQGT